MRKLQNNRCNNPVCPKTKFQNTLWAIALLFIGLLASCGDPALVDKNIAIDSEAWDYKKQVQFEVDVENNSQSYDIFLNFRHKSSYPYSNIFVLFHQQHPDGHQDTSRVEIRLAEPDGRWLGSGTGALFSYQQLVKSNYYFPDTGRYVLSFEQNMRENPLPGVSDIGVRIVPNKTP